jgi:hypothetical protein
MEAVKMFDMIWPITIPIQALNSIGKAKEDTWGG